MRKRNGEYTIFMIILMAFCLLIFLCPSAYTEESSEETGSGGGPGGTEDSFGSFEDPPGTESGEGSGSAGGAGSSGFGAGFGGSGFGAPPFSIYGYLSNRVIMTVPVDEEGAGKTRWGNTTTLRLKGEWTPEESITFHAEASYIWNQGQSSSILLMEALGYPSPLSPINPAITWGDFQQLNPQDNFLGTFNLDHAWGLVSLGPVDLKLGKLPIAWGTGYVFNPTDRVNQLGSLEGREEETPGTLGIMPSVMLIDAWGITGYLAFQDRSKRQFILPGDKFIENYPFGVKVFGVIGSFDFSTGFIKEVYYSPVSAEYQHAYYWGYDFFGAIEDFGIYSEGTVAMPREGNRIASQGDYRFFDALTVTLGGEYNFAKGPSIKLEYFHYGPGSLKKEDYDFTELLTGEKMVLGRDYLFLYISNTFFDYLETAVAGLVNLNDGSFGILPEISYSFYENFSVLIGAELLFGREGTELNGAFDLATGAGIEEGPTDLTEPTFFVEGKVSF